MLAALQYFVYFLVLAFGLLGVLVNVVLLVQLSAGAQTASMLYGYFPFGGLVAMVTAWPGFLLLNYSFQDRLSVVEWAAGVVYIAPVLFAFLKPVRTYVLIHTDGSEGWVPEARYDEEQ
jgi:hypothetical protein